MARFAGGGLEDSVSGLWESFDGVAWHELEASGYEGAVEALNQMCGSTMVLAVLPDSVVALGAVEDAGDRIVVLRATAVP